MPTAKYYSLLINYYEVKCTDVIFLLYLFYFATVSLNAKTRITRKALVVNNKFLSWIH